MKKEFRCLLLLAMSVANSHFALADDPGNIVSGQAPMKTAGNIISDFPQERLITQIGNVRFENTDILISGPNGLDLSYHSIISAKGILSSGQPQIHLFDENLKDHNRNQAQCFPDYTKLF